MIVFDQRGIANTTAGSRPYTPQQLANDTSRFRSGWVKLHPESVDFPANITSLQQAKPSLPPEIANNQNNVGKYWEDNPNWSGTCDEIAKLAKPTSVINRIDDKMYLPHVNALRNVEKVPGAWLVQIKNAGHAVMDQYPAEIGKILNSVLSTTSSNN